MDTILEKIRLGRFVEAFKREKITPDLVYKMSLHDMRSVGLTDKNDIMKLRTGCISYGSMAPIFQKSTFAGAPVYQIPKEYLETLINGGFQIYDVAKLLGVSECTVYRRMLIFRLKKREFTDIDNDSLTAAVKQTLEEFPSCGERMLIEILRQKMLMHRLRDILHIHDKDGVATGKLGRLHRRVYHVNYPNEIWHVDTNHKLIRWGFVIAGAIDGFSRLVTVLHCLDNNRAGSLLELFLRGTETFGTPSRVRTDMGTENAQIAEYMYAQRGSKGIIAGKSTHNQRIERLWRDVHNGVLVYYYQLFTFMEEENILDVLNPFHMYALHYVFKHKINEKHEIWRGAWASYRVRTIGSSPLRFWTSGILNGEKTAETLRNLAEEEVGLPAKVTPALQPNVPEINNDRLQKRNYL